MLNDEQKIAKIESWRIVMEDENGQVIEFGTDIPESISSPIDNLIRESYKTTF